MAGLLEWAEFAWHLYGHPRASRWRCTGRAGQPVMLESRLEGARQVRRSFPRIFSC